MRKNKLMIILLICLTFMLNFSSISDSTISANTNTNAAEDSSWQIVDQKYNNGDFNYSSDGAVRVQKNVMPTSNTNQFQMYLNVETKLSWEDVLQLSSILISPSNKTAPPPEWVSAGNLSWLSPYPVTGKTASVYVQFYTMENGREKLISNNTFYAGTNKVPNGSYSVGNPFVQLDKPYIQQPGAPSFGSFVGGNNYAFDENTQRNPLKVDISAIYSKYDFLETSPKVISLSDEMGDYITYNGKPMSNQSIYGLTTSPNEKGNEVLNWNMSQIDLGPIEGSYDNGAFASDQLVQYLNSEGKISYYRKEAYTLNYDLSLNTKKDGFVNNYAYDCNTIANVGYSLGNDTNKSVEFKVPRVKYVSFSELANVNKTSQEIDYNKFKIKLQVDAKGQGSVVQTPGRDIVLVMDISNSMTESDIQNAKTAMTEFVSNEKIGNGKNSFSIVTFNTYNQVLKHSDGSTFTKDVEKVKKTIQNIQKDSVEVNGKTNIQGGIYSARKALEEIKSNDGVIILMTDGLPTAMYKAIVQSGYVKASPSTPKDKELGYQRPYVFEDIGYTRDNMETANGTNIPRQLFTIEGQMENKYHDAIEFSENEALLAKRAEYELFTIGYNLGSAEIRISDALKRMASPDYDGKKHAYDATQGGLSEIYKMIANDVIVENQKVIYDAVVTDPMSDYVNLLNVPNGTYVYNDSRIAGKVIFSQGRIVVSNDVKGRQVIKWEIGEIEEFAVLTLEYYVSLKEEYIDDTEYPANDTTVLNYKDPFGEPLAKPFPIPNVREEKANLSLSKIVNGNDDIGKEFVFHIIGRNDDSKIVYKNDIVLKGGETISLKDLPFGNYIVVESTPMEYAVSQVSVRVGGNEIKQQDLKKVMFDLKPIKNGYQGHVVFTNTFAHQGYFRDNAECVNQFGASK